MRALLVFSLLLALGACTVEPLGDAPEAPAPALILVSIDGFRHDVLDLDGVEAPTLRRLAEEGVRARRLVPVYPTKTFPNHYTLVTGLHPGTHGIVANTIQDPSLQGPDGGAARFSLSDREALRDPRWWGGEPIWNTAERQGVRAGTAFWPGSEAPIGGGRPSRWLEYDGSLPYAARVDTALAWLALPAAERPGFLTLYFEGVDTAAHRHGPRSPEAAAAVAEVDAALARLLQGLGRQGAAGTTDLVIVSDHGMAETSPERVILLDEAVDLDAVGEVVWGTPSFIWTGEGVDPAVVAATLDRLDHLSAHVPGETPERWRYRDHVRIPSVVLTPEVGWKITSRDYLARYPERLAGGDHGYDNAAPDMHGLFLAWGPRFRRGLTVDSVAAIDVYEILAGAMGLEPAPNEGDAAAARRVLR